MAPTTFHQWTIQDTLKMGVLESFPAGAADMIITDPPYTGLSLWDISYLHSQFKRICQGTILVFSPPERPWVMPADQYGFWIKPSRTMNISKRYPRFVEQVFIYGSGPAWNINSRSWSQFSNVWNDLVDTTSKHPHRKPPSLIERFVLNHTNPGHTILDPFAGSGVLQEVCIATRRNSISIDIDPLLATEAARILGTETLYVQR